METPAISAREFRETQGGATRGALTPVANCRCPGPRHRRLLALLFATFVGAVSHCADGDLVTYANGKEATGTVLSYERGHLALMQPRGEPDSILFSRVREIKFAAGGRCAIFRLKKDKGNGTPVRVSLFEFGKFQGQTPAGEEVAVAAAAVETAAFFPVPAFEKQLKVPFVQQQPDYCGEACVEMVTAYWERRVSQDAVNAACAIGKKRGAYSDELERGIPKLGLRTTERFNFPGKTEADFLQDRANLIRAIGEDHPVLLGVWYDPEHKRNAATWGCDHFVLLTGYDLAKAVFFIHDPARDAPWQVTFEAFTKHRKNRFGSVYSIEFLGLK